MKRQLSLIGASTLMTLGANAFAQTTNVTLYGLVDLAFESAHTGRETINRITSGSIFMSRWGLTGTEDLGSGLKAVFKLESGFAADTGEASGGRAFSRQSTVGIDSSTWGRFEMGRMPTQINEATSAFWMGRYGAGNFTFSPGTIFTHDNGIKYTAPKLGNTEVSAHYDFGEGTAGCAMSLQALYRDQEITALAGVFNSNAPRTIATPGDEFKLYTIAGSYKLGTFQPLVMVQVAKSNAGPAQVNRYNANFGLDINIGANLVRLEYEFVKDKARSNADAKALSIRYDHRMSKRTTLYAGAVKIMNDANVYYPIVGASGSSPVARPIPASYNGANPSSFIVGIAHAF